MMHGAGTMVRHFSSTRDRQDPKIIVSWKYNAWGDKYPYDLDEQIPGLIGKVLDIPVYYPGIIMEGGAVEFNGAGTLLTTTSCLLHENRNPDLHRIRLNNTFGNFTELNRSCGLEMELTVMIPTDILTT